MRLLTALTLMCVPFGSARAQEKKSFLDAEPTGWTDLLDKDLKSWKRVNIPPGKPVADKNPWKVAADGKTLICDGVGVHEMLLYDKELADGIFHVEYKFTPVEGKKGYNSGIYARNNADGSVWHQAQVGGSVGHFFGSTLVDGAAKRFSTKKMGEERGKPIGEWNTMEIICKGKTMTLHVNGHQTTEWTDCQVPKGYVGVEAEGYLIEFRNLKWK